MPLLELFFWRVPDREGRMRKTRYQMTVAQAREAYGDAAECLDETRELSEVPRGRRVN